ncbi:MAG: gluconokinase [Lentisphaerales bacterium]|nr:gluconokinase [Lentisphaerales bacterium]
MYVYVIMGVSGCGKSTVGKLLANSLNIPFYDGDDFHPDENIERMKSGRALDCMDHRIPWLVVLNKNITEWNQSGGAVLACSSLRRIHRNLLRERNRVRFIYLHGEREVLLDRMNSRNHFMPSSLLDDQLETLQVPIDAMHVSISQAPDEIVKEILSEIQFKENSHKCVTTLQ